MTATDRETKTAVTAASSTALLMIGYQTAAKATRDALFLSSFDVSSLPLMIMVAAGFSIVLALVTSRILTRVSPARLVPVLFALSAALLIVEWRLIDDHRRVIAVVVYLHYAALGALLISGFWSIVNERFDPRTAKRQVNRIVAGATVGGLLGGILAERVAVMATMEAMLPILALLHFACGTLVVGWARSRTPRHVADVDPSPASGISVIARRPYVRNIAILVLLTTVGEVMIDYVFKARATEAMGRGDDLLRLFGVFYTGVALVVMVVETTLARAVLTRLGLGRTVRLLPIVVSGGGALALLVPGFFSAAAARAGESVTRSALYRPGYELLFGPLAKHEKRTSKTLLDVGVVRMGDIAGGLIVQAVLLLSLAGAGGNALNLLLGLAVGLGIIASLVARRIQDGYVKALESSLRARAGALDLRTVDDAILRTMMDYDATGAGIPALESAVSSGERASRAGSSEVERPALWDDGFELGAADPVVKRIAELRAKDLFRVRRALLDGPIDPALLPHVVPLLARDEIVSEVIETLRAVARRSVGQLVDFLLDPEQPFAVRRRIPLVLAACPENRAVEGLVRALSDERFEVRYRVGRVLNRLFEIDPTLTIDRQRIERAVLREVQVDQSVWESNLLYDRLEDDEWSPVVDDLLRDRANRSLEHVFTMLSLVYPREPLKIAFRGLHTDDPHLKGTALEYLESTIPSEIRTYLWPFLEIRRRSASQPKRSSAEVLRDLMDSNRSIVMSLEDVKKARTDESGGGGDGTADG